MKYRLLTLGCLLFICNSLLAQTILHCGTVIDGVSNDTTKSVSIIVENGIIVAMEEGYVVGNSGDEVIDLKHGTVMPGLMDMHVHITSEVSPTRFADRFRLDPVDFAFASVRYAERTLMAGFTTVRDLGSAFDLAISMRNAINKGYLTGPRIITSGKSLATTGGHADPTNGTNASLIGDLLTC
jgi:imidazolonepropionase-like amidohydrolase